MSTPFLMGRGGSPTAKPTITRMMRSMPTTVDVFTKAPGSIGCEDPNVHWAQFPRSLAGFALATPALARFQTETGWKRELALWHQVEMWHAFRWQNRSANQRTHVEAG
jgi:hypothetical protein